jgi:FkbM family methyltransferase
MGNLKYYQKLIRSIKHNNNGDVLCYLRRLPILYAIFLQKLKINRVVTIPLFFNTKMHVVTGEAVSGGLISFGYSEIALSALIIELLGPGSSFVDVGTHYGYEALLASELVGETGNIISFEPNPFSYSIANRNLQKNNNIILHNYAVGSYDGKAKMRDNDLSKSAFNNVIIDDFTGKVIQVQIVKLDSILKERKYNVSFIKVDVEGLEMEVIKGAVEMIKLDKPYIVLEADMPENGRPSKRAYELQEFMKSLNYKACSFDFQDDILHIDELGKFPTYHANILFMPYEN